MYQSGWSFRFGGPTAVTVTRIPPEGPFRTPYLIFALPRGARLKNFIESPDQINYIYYVCTCKYAGVSNALTIIKSCCNVDSDKQLQRSFV